MNEEFADLVEILAQYILTSTPEDSEINKTAQKVEIHLATHNPEKV